MTDGEANLERRLSQDCEFDLYVKSLSESSNRVRYAIVAIVVASIVIVVGFKNSRVSGWTNSRLALARAALVVEESKEGLPRQTDEQYSERYLETAAEWALRRGLRNSEDIKNRIKTLEEAQVNNVIIMRMPILGLGFDVNDLGLFAGLFFLVLMGILTFSVSRYHENLFLGLWRVREVHKEEKKLESGASKANLLYHALVMTQVFSTPPSLGRWRGKPRIHLVKELALTGSMIFVPFLLQCLILYHDYSTRYWGELLNGNATRVSLLVQGACLIASAILVVMCLCYIWSNGKRWYRAFNFINPSMKRVPRPTWREWVQIRKPRYHYEVLIAKEREETRKKRKPQ